MTSKIAITAWSNSARATQRWLIAPCACNNFAEKVQFAVKKVVGTGHDEDRQLQRPRPGQQVGERHPLVQVTMNDDGIGWHRADFVMARALDQADGSADEHQALGRLTGFQQALGDPRLHVGAKGKAAEYHGQVAEAAARIIEHGQYIVGFALALS
jgi:hypothetical protein